MAHRLKRKGEDWRQRLPAPIRLRDGSELKLLSDCRRYVLALDESEQSLAKWQRAAELMLDAAAVGDLEEVVLQFEKILFQQNKLKI